MFAPRTAEHLSRRKLELRSRIAERRRETAQAIVPVVRVLIWVDVARLLWRRLPALTRLARGLPAVPAATAPLPGKWQRLRPWLPMILGAMRLFRPGSAARPERAAPRSRPPDPRPPIHAHDFPQSAERGPR